MRAALVNPRSTLHALRPYGVGTPDVESLLSYFCRLSVSHGVLIPALARLVVETLGCDLREGFDWHERNLSGMGEAAQTWAGALSSLTGVENLDQLTLLPWRNVVAQKGLAAGRGRWCPECLAEDLECGRAPYFRLGWDIKAVTICHKHKTPLVDVCADCGRTGARHKSSCVMPGWCIHCGAFLGRRLTEEQMRDPAPEECWKAAQVGKMLAAQGAMMGIPSRERLEEAIRELVARLDHGKGASFARNIGLSKGTVHYWVQGETLPTLDASLRVAAYSGLALSNLLVGNLEGWEPPKQSNQLVLALILERHRRVAARDYDWEGIREMLRSWARQFQPISVVQAAHHLGVDVRLLYLRANKEARTLGAQWKAYQTRKRRATQAKAQPYLEVACRELLAEGRGISLRDVQERVPKEILSSVERVFDMLDDIKQELGVS